MNRRSLLTGLGLFFGGLLPGRLRAQEPESNTPRAGARNRRVADSTAGSTATRRPRAASNDESEPASGKDRGAAPPADPADRESLPAAFPSEAGHLWRDIDIAKYTGLPHTGETPPQMAIVDWIFRRTTTAPWHGDKVAVLAASQSRLRVYHNAKILKQVEEVVERFTDAFANVLTLRVRFAAAVDSRWRYQVYRKLNILGSGPQGQQIWALKMEDAALVLSQMQIWQGFQMLADRRFEIINGQTITVETTEKRTFTGNLLRDSAVGMGFQPKTETLEEGVVLRLSPLLSYEGDTIDAAVELTTNNVRAYQRTKVLAPKEIGPTEMTIDVPEVSGTRLNVPLKGWRLGETLLISGGIQPGILQDKGGLFKMRIPGTVPTTTELLAFVDVELSDRASRTRQPE